MQEINDTAQKRIDLFRFYDYFINLCIVCVFYLPVWNKQCERVA